MRLFTVLSRPIACVIFKQVALCLIFSLSIFAANPKLVLQVSTEAAPPGGTAQIKIFSATPQPIAIGGIALDLDPTVFGPITDVAVFSANGDAYGIFTSGTGQIDVEFGCGPNGKAGVPVPVVDPASNGIGKVRNLPILVINAPILASAPSKTVTVTAHLGQVPGPPSAFLDPNGDAYDVSFTPGSVQVIPNLSVTSVVPGGGQLPAGTVVRITGTNFSPFTTVFVEGVFLSNTHFVEPDKIDVTLGAPAELTGKGFALRNTHGAAIEYFSFLPGGSGMIFPVEASSAPILLHSPSGARTGTLFIQNPNLAPAELTIDSSLAGTTSRSTATIPPGGTFSYHLQASLGFTGSITSSQPIRAVQLVFDLSNSLVSPVFPLGIPFLVQPAPFSPSAPPLIGSVVNAASQVQGAVSPGEIITINGIAAGSPNVIGFMLDPSGNVATNYGGAQILFDGKPAPLIYSSSTQTNVIVPYEIANQKSTNITVVVNGISSPVAGVAVVDSAPAIFTLGANGVGQGAVLNQDNSINGPDNPAARDTIIQIFATGAGVTSPPGVTGEVTKSDLKFPKLTVHVAIGGMDASVIFAGSAPDAVAGLFQVNARVPQGVTPGPAAPILLTVGNAQSPDGVTIAVK